MQPRPITQVGRRYFFDLSPTCSRLLFASTFETLHCHNGVSGHTLVRNEVRRRAEASGNEGGIIIRIGR
jgi:hypothetical protein